MPTVAERLRHIELKVKRAKTHISELDAGIRRFLDSKPYLPGTKRDPDTRRLIYYLASAQPTPDCLALIAGDVIQNLMSALDHLAYEIVCSDTGDSPPNRNGIYFPISGSSCEDEAKKGGKIEGALPESVKAIDTIKANIGGNNQLRILNRLNNIDKHRLLIAVGGLFSMVNVGPAGVERMNKVFGTNYPDVNLWARLREPIFPMKEGDELLIELPDAEVSKKYQFGFEIAFYEVEAGVVEAKPLIETLHQLSALVEGIVAGLTSRLRETP